MSGHYPTMTASEIAAAVAGGRLSARDAVDAALDRIAAVDPRIDAFTKVTAERAVARAEASDRARAGGAAPGPLEGVPFAVKNLVDVAGEVTLAGSRIKADEAPAARDAVVVERLEAAGAILVGALNMGEYAYDFTGENEHRGPSRNPHDTARMTGGSSGGSGAAVAGGLVPLSVGSDTNGSIRVPSAWCGIYGLKPTYGRVPRTGSFPFVDSLDHLGPMARSPRDLAAALMAMQGVDAGDPGCAERAPCDAIGALERGADGLRLGVAGGYFAAEGEAGEAVERCAAALGVTREVELPGSEAARAAAYVMSNVEGAALHFETMTERLDDFGASLRERLVAGAMVPGVAYVKAQRLRRAYAESAARIFEDVDAILAPATPMPAPEIGQQTMILQGREQAFRPHIGIYTQPISFIGLPVVCVPVHGLGPMPLGVQVIAPAWREDIALRVAEALAQAGVTSAPVPEGLAA